MEDLAILFDEINDLLAEPAGGDLTRFERTLTDGYARALSIEAERWRLTKRMNELAASLGRGEAEAKTREISSVVERLETTNDELTRLRVALSALRDRADAVRAATAS